MLCLSGFELYSRWVPLTFPLPNKTLQLVVAIAKCQRNSQYNT